MEKKMQKLFNYGLIKLGWSKSVIDKKKKKRGQDVTFIDVLRDLYG